MAATRIGTLGPITTRIFNPLTRRFMGRLPGFGVLTHIGRASGRVYRTPLLVFRRGDGYVVGMWYGSDVNWVKNVFAAGGADMRASGRDVRLVEPELVVDPTRRLLPAPLRFAGRLVRLTEFLQLRTSDPATPARE